MQETLPEAAPSQEPAAPSVEEPAPGTGGEVVTESAQAPTGYVEAARFNGLMGRFNRTQNELDAARAEIQELASRASAQGGNVPDNDAITELQSQVGLLTQLLTQERLQSARDKAIKEYPEAEAFADLIVADSPEAMLDMAKTLAERVKKTNPPTPTPEAEGEETSPAGEQPPANAEPPAPPAPVVAGGTTVTPEPQGAVDAVVEAIKNKDFPSFLKARRAQVAEPLVLS